MEVQRDRSVTEIPFEDLDVVSRAVMLRLAEPADEAQRVRGMRELLWASSELTRALSMHTQHAREVPRPLATRKSAEVR